jgi:hypothetical protein
MRSTVIVMDLLSENGQKTGKAYRSTNVILMFSAKYEGTAVAQSV